MTGKWPGIILIDENGHPVLVKLKSREKFSMKPIHFAVHMLDPKFISSNLNRDALAYEKFLSPNEKAWGTEIIMNRLAYKYVEESDRSVDVSFELSTFNE